MKILILAVAILNFVILFPRTLQQDEGSGSVCCHLDLNCLLLRATKR
uniref:Uncharacterized protein n=1 Tax=Nannospalax galili TaxID=1026970 RepID=A0A8C6WB23_NANGA